MAKILAHFCIFESGFFIFVIFEKMWILRFGQKKRAFARFPKRKWAEKFDEKWSKTAVFGPF